MTDASFWRGKRVFLTGHTGFKGMWLGMVLECLGADVTGYALKPLAQPNLFDICGFKARSNIGDIRCMETLSTAFQAARPEIVIHMAAQPLVLASYREPRYTYDVNVMGTVNLLECARYGGGVLSVLNVTTDKVYLNLNRYEGYAEDEKLCGFDPYANSKSCSELVTYSYANAFFSALGIPVSTARSGNVIGGGDFAENRLIPDCARGASANEVIDIRNPNSVRPYQHVLDTLFAYLLIAQRQYEDYALSGAYNIGPDEKDCATSGEMAALFCGAWGKGARWRSVSADTPHEDAVLKLDCSKITRALGWRPLWDIERAVSETARWYRLYFEGGDARGLMLRQITEYMGACL